MKKHLLHILLIVTVKLSGQGNVVARVDSADMRTIHIKWYFQQLVNRHGCNIYRRTPESEWIRINRDPVQNNYQPTIKDLEKDPQLKNYVNMLHTGVTSQNGDIRMLALLLKSFSSAPLAKCMGVTFDDDFPSANGLVQYKVARLENGKEVESAVSGKIKTGHFEPIDPPAQVSFSVTGKIVSFRWLAEPLRYWGVNIYRKGTGDTKFTRITNDPLLLSTTGKGKYPATFYSDKKDDKEFHYQYYFEAIDFFGGISRPSEKITVNFRDTDFPTAPGSVSHVVSENSVVIRWQKATKEKDFAGYNFYLSDKNDSDFVRLNKTVIARNDSTFTFGKISGVHVIKISSVDTALNESFSNPYTFEVPDIEPPACPAGVTIHTETGIIEIRWYRNHEKDVQGYFVYRKIAGTDDDHFVKITPRPIKENIYRDRLEKNTKNKQCYRIAAVDDNLNKSDYSATVEASMPDVLAPRPPFIKSVAGNAGQPVKLEWMSNAEPDLAGYHVYRINLSDTSSRASKINLKIIPWNISAYTDRSALPGNLYEYFLVAADSTLNISGPSNRCKIKIKTDAGEGVKFTKANARYSSRKKNTTIKWKIETETEIKGFVVYKRGPSETTFTGITGLISDLRLIDKDIKASTRYSYQVRAYTQSGDVFRSDPMEIIVE